MQVSPIKNEGLDFQVKISIPSSEIDNKIKKELSDLKKKVKLPGFRPGMVPDSTIKIKYGDATRQDVAEREIKQAVNQVVKEHELNIVARPKIDELQNEEGKDLEFVAKFELLPSISMPDFKQIKISKPKLLVADKEVDEQIEKLASFTKEYSKESKAKIKKGDQVTIDAKGYVNDELFEGGTLTNHKLVIGSGAFIPGFEDQLISQKVGNEVEVNVVFPENYHAKDLSGKPAKFVVNIREVHTGEPVKIDEELAKKFGGNSLQELRDSVTKRMENEFAGSINVVMKMNLFDQLEKILTFAVPASLLIQEKNILESEANNNNSSESLFDGKSEEEISAYYNKLALRRVRIGLLLAEYTKIKGLRVEREDIKNFVIAQAKSFPGQENMVIDFYNKNPQAIEGLKGSVLEEKAVQYIFANEVTVTEKTYTREKLEKFLEKEEENATVI